MYGIYGMDKMQGVVKQVRWSIEGVLCIIYATKEYIQYTHVTITIFKIDKLLQYQLGDFAL